MIFSPGEMSGLLFVPQSNLTAAVNFDIILIESGFKN